MQDIDQTTNPYLTGEPWGAFSEQLEENSSDAKDAIVFTLLISLNDDMEI